MRQKLTVYPIVNGRPGPAIKTAFYSNYGIAARVRELYYEQAARNGRRVFVGIEPAESTHDTRR